MTAPGLETDRLEEPGCPVPALAATCPEVS